MERFANNASATLNEDIDNLVTSFDVDYGSILTWPTVPQFRIRIDDEIMTVTGITPVSGTIYTWDVSRPTDNSVVASHTNGATINCILTRESLESLRQMWGNTLVDADFDDTGIGTMERDYLSYGSKFILWPAATADPFALCYSIVDVAGKTGIAAGLSVFAVGESTRKIAFGVGLRESATGKIMMIHYVWDGTDFRIKVSKYTDETDSSPTHVAEVGHVYVNPGNLYLQAIYVGGVVYFDLIPGGFDGQGSGAEAQGSGDCALWSEAVTAFFTTSPDQVIIGGYNHDDFADASEYHYAVMLLERAYMLTAR